MSRRKILIGASIAGHAALFAGVFVYTAWDLDQLDYEARSRSPLAVMVPPSAEGWSYTPPKVDLEPARPPRVVVNETRQPRRPDLDLQITYEPGPSEPGEGLGAGPGEGPGDGPEGGEPCQEAGGQRCGTLPAPPPPPLPELPKPPPAPKVANVTPEILRGLRLRGETAIHPPRDVYDEMSRTRSYRTSASIKLCLTGRGTVSSITLMKSTSYPAYDEALVAAARRWIYRPYAVNGTPVPACGIVTFQYAMK